MAGRKTVYMKVTRDKYELPVAIADTAAELARKTGTSSSAIRSAIYRERHGRTKRSSYKCVEIEEE